MTNTIKKTAEDIQKSAHEAVDQASDAVQRNALGAFHQIGDAVDGWTGSAGKGLQDWGKQIQQFGRQQGGIAANAADVMGDRLQAAGSSLAEFHVGGLGEALTTAVKRNPLAAVLVAFGIGWILARRPSR